MIAMMMYAAHYRARVYVRHFLRRYRAALIMTAILWTLIILGAVALLA